MSSQYYHRRADLPRSQSYDRVDALLSSLNSITIEHDPILSCDPAGAEAGRRGRRGRAGSLLPPAPVHHEARDRHQARRCRHGRLRLLARRAEQRLRPYQGCGHGHGIVGGVQRGPAGEFFFDFAIDDGAVAGAGAGAGNDAVVAVLRLVLVVAT